MLKRTPLCITVFLFVYYIHTLTDFDRSPIKRPFLRESNGKKYDRSTEGKKHLVVMLQINGFQNGRETREKNICCKVRARAYAYVYVHAARDHDRDKEVNETGSF